MYDYANMFLCFVPLFCFVGYIIYLCILYTIYFKTLQNIYNTYIRGPWGFTRCQREARFGQEEVWTHQAAEWVQGHLACLQYDSMVIGRGSTIRTESYMGKIGPLKNGQVAFVPWWCFGSLLPFWGLFQVIMANPVGCFKISIMFG